MIEKHARLRAGLLATALLAACAILLSVVHRHYPLQHWLVLRYLGYWLLSACFSLACTVLGFGALRRVLGRVLPIREQLALSFPLGLLGYFWLAFVAGLLGLYGTAFFVLAPALMLGVGARPAYRYARRFFRHVRAARARPPSRRPAFALYRYPVLALGLVSLGLIYFSILSPINASYDARWYHLPLAEEYAHAGGIFRFPEGWVMGSYPQLTSLIFAWAFQMPGRLFDQVCLSAHLEYWVFLWTLFAVPALVRRLLPRAWRPRPRAALSWVAVFLFPGLYLYDSSLNLSADHVAALWGIPIFLMLLRAWPALSARECAVLAALMAGALLTKYTAVLIVAPPVLALCARAAWLAVRRLPGGATAAMRGTGVAAVVGVVLTSAHWLKNWVWYGDPLYPQLHALLELRPWVADANIPYHFDIAVPWHPSRDLAGVLETLQVTLTYSFVHHDWAELHGKAPVFGFLFTLTLLCLPFLGRVKRLWGLYGAGHLGVFLWYSISWQDRYLQVLVPWMAVAVAATLTLAWRLHVGSRLAAVLLVGAQVLWGSDVYFFTTHRLIGSPVLAAVELINSGRKQDYEQRFRIFDDNVGVREALPASAVVLAHESRQTFGLGRRRVHDRPGTQGSLYYQTFASPRALHDRLRALGVTHLAFRMPEGISAVAADLVFYDFAVRHTAGARRAGAWTVAELPKPPPSSKRFGRHVAWLACDGTYAAGSYRLEDLAVSPFDPRRPYPRPRQALTPGAPLDLALEGADYLVFDARCFPALTGAQLAKFAPLTRRGSATLLARRRSR
jgi:hypothetical protein